MSQTPTYLVADIGGTNTRVGLADASGLIEDSTRRYKNSENASFEAVLQHYVSDMAPGPLQGACAGAAGLVSNGTAHMTNLDWAIDREVIARVTEAPVVDVINDLQAQGYALDDLPGASLKVLQAGKADPKAARLVIGLGTGFNIVPVHRDRDRLLVPSCEAGHMNAPFHPELEGIYRKITEKLGRVTIEWTLAGQGLQNVFEAHSGCRPDAGAIMQLVSQGDATARAAFADYIKILGHVTGDFALSHLPYGGIYFTGGVARAVTPYFQQFDFAKAMQDKGEFADLTAGFAVTLIDDDFAALKGCARYLSQLTA